MSRDPRKDRARKRRLRRRNEAWADDAESREAVVALIRQIARGQIRRFVGETRGEHAIRLCPF